MHHKERLAQALTTANLGDVDLNCRSGIAGKANYILARLETPGV